jgi:hypothetical protein
MGDLVIAAAAQHHLLVALVDPMQEEQLAGVAVCANFDTGDLPQIEGFGGHWTAYVEAVWLDGGGVWPLERFPVGVAAT